MDVDIITNSRKRLIEQTCQRQYKRSRSIVNGRANEEDEEIAVDPTQLKNMIRSRMGDFLGKEDIHKHNHIYFDDDVTRASCRRLISKIDELNIKLGKLECDFDIENPPKIYLHINSFGGSVFSAFSVIDTMRRSKYPIVTIIEGASASAATLISVYGQERWITQHAYMLIHQLSSGCWGKMTEIEDEYDNLREITNHIMKIYEEKTHLTSTQLRKLLKHDHWWSAEKCLESGLVDKII
jgi:ATP-dependent Clp endopeptidase proteolytic subunit ClpP